MAIRVLLIEDHQETSRLIARTLSAAPDAFECAAAHSAQAGLRHLTKGETDCVLLDYHLPDTEGLECLREIRHLFPDLPVIVVTGAGSEELAVEALKLGAHDYVVKHGSYASKIALLVREAIGNRELKRSEGYCRGLFRTGGLPGADQEALRRKYLPDGILGESEAMGRALHLADTAAQSDVTVLLQGESGTGKELFAGAIHRHGSRSGGPFIPHNCATVPESLLESELFGHVRGAFTGADRQHRGLLDQAEGGTLFLDEVSEASLTVQAKLLRVLQDGFFRPVGGNEQRRANVRIIAATNRDLRAAVEVGRFRRDLYHRLCVFPIQLPPLRERREDIRPLAVSFLRMISEQQGKSCRGFTASCLQQMERYSWPGNVRELENEIHRIVLCAGSERLISPRFLSAWIAEADAPPDTGVRRLKDIVRQVEVATIRARLRQYGYNRAATARSLGISREALWAKLRTLGFRPCDTTPPVLAPLASADGEAEKRSNEDE